MLKSDLEKLLKGELVEIKNKSNEIIGAIQLDLECDMFLALKYTGKDLKGIDDYIPLNLWNTLEEAIKEVSI
ncbi:hypothetical protein CF086_17060 [Clostridium botulinum]|uniref:hypothetical protein n=1 Tax=Clostridium botulinum TaxID=1491 RepID=UPI0007737C91|nr:hypothetical protein [Clostridium botulinum]MBN3352006.1 hypothetical protein [Clostridium botulinum]